MSDECLICQGTDTEKQSRYRHHNPVFKDMYLTRCNSCGMVFSIPMPKDEDIQDFNNSYFSSAHGVQTHGEIESSFFSAIALLRISYIEKYFINKNIQVNSVIEFGPGYGYFAENWLNKYPKTSYYAVETDSSCYERLKNLGVQLFDVTKENKKFDLVVMSHVLEHVSNPVSFINDAMKNLRSGGVIFIEVPCRDWEHKFVDEPHLLFFDKKPIQLLLEKSGCEDIVTSYYGQEINQLQNISLFLKIWRAIRSRAISLGIVFPFSHMRPGMEKLDNSLQRAVVAPYKAHRESANPAWWLRAIAIKK